MRPGDDESKTLPDTGSGRTQQLLHSDVSQQLRVIHAIGVSSPDFLYVFDLDQRFIYVSPPLLTLWGKSLEEVIGKNFEDLGYPAELVKLHREQLKEAIAGTTVRGANSYVSPQGVEGHYEYTFVPVLAADGRVESIVGTTRDVTTKLAVERERAEVLGELREREAQFRQFADAIPQLAWIARADGHIFWYNSRWYEYTGTTAADMEGWGWQAVHDPDELPKVLVQWKQSLATGERFEMAFPLRSATNEFRLFLTRVQPIRNSRGEVVRWFGTNTDIEIQRQAIAERDRALASANEANRAKDEFLAMLGHELRNPLSPIVTALKLLQMRGALSREYEVIDRQVKHLARLVDDLLDIARITQGKVELRKVPIEVAAAILSGVEMAAPLLEKHGQRLNLDVPPHGLMVAADPDRLAQVVSNLVTNASKFSEPRSEIFVSAQKQGDAVRIQVRDTGVGIAKEMLNRVFQAFVQQPQKLDRSSGGLGLGLSIVKNIVELHGGNVTVHSEGPGRGSEFIVELPALAQAEDPALPLREDRVYEVVEKPRERILIVDDNEDAAEVLAAFIAGLGFDVRVAHDPAAALEVAALFQPQIALLDIGLPAMDGWELGRRLRAMMGSGSLRLIAVTGYSQEGDRRTSQAHGFMGHLSKPVDPAELAKLLSR